ncbi:MAG: hypothetical protein M1296_00925 [Chloroflexi bacterium]|nr:hypothetical protein [Chloroflexota bacterium]
MAVGAGVVLALALVAVLTAVLVLAVDAATEVEAALLDVVAALVEAALLAVVTEVLAPQALSRAVPAKLSPLTAAVRRSARRENAG